MRIALGKGWLDRFTVCEFKRLFSIYIHRFNTIEQDRFHSHAFHGIAIVLKGGYHEQYLEDSSISEKWVGPGIRFIPRSYTHKLMESKPNSWSIIFAGPWAKTWHEENEKWYRRYTWGRKIVEQKSI